MDENKMPFDRFVMECLRTDPIASVFAHSWQNLVAELINDCELCPLHNKCFPDGDENNPLYVNCEDAILACVIPPTE